MSTYILQNVKPNSLHISQHHFCQIEQNTNDSPQLNEANQAGPIKCTQFENHSIHTDTPLIEKGNTNVTLLKDSIPALIKDSKNNTVIKSATKLTCIITDIGKLMCWWNVKQMKNFHEMTPLGFEEGTIQVSIGMMFFCAINSQNELFCWRLIKPG